MIRPLALLLAPALVAASHGSPQAIRYAPAADTALRRVVQLSTELDLEDMQTVMNGQEIPQEYMPEIEITVMRASTLVVTDRIVEAAGGRPLLLERTFDSIASEATEEVTLDGDPNVRQGTASSPLEGRGIRFTWNENGEEYEAASTDDEKPIEGLLEDMDLRAFLPDEEVEVGDTWKLEAAVLAELLRPGGDLDLEWEGDELRGTNREGAVVSGQITARFASIQDDGLALIEVTGEVETHDEWAGDLEHIPIVDGTATTTSTTTFVLDGRLFWNVEAGHLDSLELETDMSVESLTRKDPGQPGGDFESTVHLIGTWECRVGVTMI
jgi:hypothetical protein